MKSWFTWKWYLQTCKKCFGALSSAVWRVLLLMLVSNWKKLFGACYQFGLIHPCRCFLTSYYTFSCFELFIVCYPFCVFRFILLGRTLIKHECFVGSVHVQQVIKCDCAGQFAMSPFCFIFRDICMLNDWSFLAHPSPIIHLLFAFSLSKKLNHSIVIFSIFIQSYLLFPFHLSWSGWIQVWSFYAELIWVLLNLDFCLYILHLSEFSENHHPILFPSSSHKLPDAANNILVLPEICPLKPNLSTSGNRAYANETGFPKLGSHCL